MTFWQMSLAVGIALAILLIAWVISTSNRFRKLQVKINEADSGIDVALTRRHDTLTKIIDTVRAYASHETEVLEKMVRLRAGMSIAEKSEASQLMDEATRRINVVAEGYPELRSSENYRQLQESILESEDHLQAARRVYNMNVSSFNQAIAVFPAKIIADRSRISPKDFFQAEEASRADVKVKVDL